MRRVCVFCGSHPGRDPAFKAAAEAMGSALASRKLVLVYGGGKMGLMGAIASRALAERGEVIGIIPRQLARAEIAHDDLTELRVVESMHERKFTMAQLADAFITLPGGIGTLEECCEMLTWAQLAIHTKPCGILNTNGYYDPLLAFLDRAVADGFLKRENRDLLTVGTNADELLDSLNARSSRGVEP